MPTSQYGEKEKLLTMQNHTTPALAQAATPTVNDMVGATIRCIFYRPFERSAIIKVGKVTKVMMYKNELLMWVVASDGKQKWVNESDFLNYVR